MDGYVLRVKTEQLLTTADEASRQIDRMEKRLQMHRMSLKNPETIGKGAVRIPM